MKSLTTEDFMRTCPSFYATAPKHDVSDKYSFINTREIAVTLWELGWMPVFAREAAVKDQSNRGLTRHIVRWTRKDLDLGEERIDLVGLNSHNRSAAFQFHAGIFRMVCENGIISKSEDFGSFKIKHIGDIHEQVKTAVAGISGFASKLADKVQDWKTIELSPNEQGIFARTAHDYIYTGPDGEVNSPLFTPRQLLTVHRLEDSIGTGHIQPKQDLWTTFNVIQENALKGGLKGRGSTGRRMSTRAVKSIEKDVKLNQALWSMAEQMASIKRAA